MKITIKINGVTTEITPPPGADVTMTLDGIDRQEMLRSLQKDEGAIPTGKETFDEIEITEIKMNFEAYKI